MTGPGAKCDFCGALRVKGECEMGSDHSWTPSGWTRWTSKNHAGTYTEYDLCSPCHRKWLDALSRAKAPTCEAEAP